MSNKFKILPTTVSLCLLSTLVTTACDKKSESESTTTPYASAQGRSFVAARQLAVSSCGLTAANSVIYVIAFNAELGKTKVAKVDASGKFE
ncbi:MAG: hypothetical protein H7318_04605 [Oligoflexus sp.]|nr:hypothetical protein [Oligoflexus sp.]